MWVGRGGPGLRRQVHRARRRYARAVHESAYCRRQSKREARWYARNAHHSHAWWKHYYSRKQVLKRRRRAAHARRVHARIVRREKHFLALAGKKYVSYPRCPSRLSRSAKHAVSRHHHHHLPRYQAPGGRRASPARPAARATSSARAARASRSRRASQRRR